MFTGIIEGLCPVKSANRAGGAMRLTVELGELGDDAKIGDSIAVNGVCLTIAELNRSSATFDVSGETLDKSAVSSLNASSKVNIERAMKAGDRFGGHIVQGHIDGTAIIKAIERQGQFANIKFAASGELLDLLVVKGSVAVDGISLTIADMDADSFKVAVIPQTLEETTLGAAKIGDVVNVETDIIVRTVKKQLEKIMPGKESLTVEKLKELGF